MLDLKAKKLYSFERSALTIQVIRLLLFNEAYSKEDLTIISVV